MNFQEKVAQKIHDVLNLEEYKVSIKSLELRIKNEELGAIYNKNMDSISDIESTDEETEINN